MLNKNRIRKALWQLMFAGLATPGLLSGRGDAFGQCDPNLAVELKGRNSETPREAGVDEQHKQRTEKTTRKGKEGKTNRDGGGGERT